MTSDSLDVLGLALACVRPGTHARDSVVFGQSAFCDEKSNVRIDLDFMVSLEDSMIMRVTITPMMIAGIESQAIVAITIETREARSCVEVIEAVLDGDPERVIAIGPLFEGVKRMGCMRPMGIAVDSDIPKGRECLFTGFLIRDCDCLINPL